MTGELGPSADGRPLALTVECRTHPRRRGRQHDVVIHADWSLETPHDLESERIALALGGHLSCLRLADEVLPAVRSLLEVRARRILPTLKHLDGSWRLAPLDGACGRCRPFPNLHRAVDHARDPAHGLAVSGAPEFLFRRLWPAVEKAHPDLQRLVVPDHLRGRLLEPDGPAQLWRAGVSPALALELYDALGLTGPAPARLLQAAAYTPAPLPWLARMVAARVDADHVTWAARSYGDLDIRTPETRQDWLTLGIAPMDVQQLLGAGYTVAEAHDYAALTSRSPRRAGQLLALWAAATCRPTAAELAALERQLPEWPEWPRVSLAAIWELRRQAPGNPSQTDLGLVLAVTGSVGAAAAAMQRGVRTWRDLIDDDHEETA